MLDWFSHSCQSESDENFCSVFTMKQKLLLVLLNGTQIVAKIAQFIICGITFNQLGCDTKMRAFIFGALAVSLIYSIVSLILTIIGHFPGKFPHTCMLITSMVFLLHVIGGFFTSYTLPLEKCPDTNKTAMWILFGLNSIVIALLQIDKHCAFCMHSYRLY